jgi:hypothetical protein
MTIDPWAAPTELHDFLFRRVCAYFSSILELGSGSGTARLVEYYNKVVTVEHDPKFLDKVEGARYIYAPIVNGWYDTNMLRNLPPHDVILVDGPPGSIGRHGFLDNIHLFNSNAPILVDDCHRPDEYDLARKIARLRKAPLQITQLTDGRAFAAIGFEL